MQRDIGAYLASKVSVTPRTLHGGTTIEDGIEIDGLDISLTTDFTNKPHSFKCVIPYSLTVPTSTKSATIVANAQGGVTTTSFADLAGSTLSVSIVTSSTGVQTVNGVAEVDVTLKGNWDFVRMQVTGAIVGTSTGTNDLDIAAVMVFGGFDVTPAV
jgi:hypothetical protein